MVIEMKVNEYEVPEDLYYTNEHSWAKVENGLVRVGITDFAQDSLQEIAFVEFPDEGAEVTHMDLFGSIESVKALADLFSPVSGTVVESNGEVVNNPELVNQSPYKEGWMILIEASNLDGDLENLMSAEDYADFLREQIEEA